MNVFEKKSGGTRTSTAIGTQAENLAADYLKTLGYRIVARNFRGAGGELDMVAYQGDVLCFVEVRARDSASCVDPLETISRQKMRRIGKAASMYIEIHNPSFSEARFDVIGIVLSTPPRMELVKNAFEL